MAILGVIFFGLGGCGDVDSERITRSTAGILVRTDAGMDDEGRYEDVVVDFADGEVQQDNELGTSQHELLWEPSLTWNSFLSFRNDSNADHSRGSLYGRATAYIDSYCSGFMISRDMLVTAHHCYEGQATLTDVRFLSNEPTAEFEVREIFRRMGFFASQLDAAADLALEGWTCTWHSRHTSRDIEYYVCSAQSFQTTSSYSVSLHPGDIFGHLDITTSVPADDAPTDDLTVNQRYAASLHQVLLSPKGRRKVSSYDDCVGSSYSSCVATVGDDTLGGSSGGASIRSSDNLAWGVANGHRFHNNGSAERDLRCSEGFFCRLNLNLWSPFSSYTTGIQYYPRISDLDPPSTTFGTSTVGGTGGSPYNLGCEDDEAVIGIVGTQYEDEWTAPGLPLVLGNFGLVCGPGRDSSSHFLQSDHATVRTAGSYDTDFVSSLDPAPTLLNRYRNSVLSHGQAHILNDEVEWFLCPAGYAVAGISVREKYSRVRAITQVRCRHMFETSQLDLLYSQTDFGTVEAGSTAASTTCGTGKFAVSASVRSGWFTDSISLFCADR